MSDLVKQEGNWQTVGKEWFKRGQALVAQFTEMHGRVDGLMWQLGDWLNEGKAMFGEKYRVALDMLEYEPQTLRLAASVAGRVDLLTRVNKLSFCHHREVAHLNKVEQEKFLGLALKHNWSTRDLRESIRKEEMDGGTVSPACFAVFVPEREFKRVAIGFSRWAQGHDIATMPLDAKLALRVQLEPIVAIYQALVEALPRPHPP